MYHYLILQSLIEVKAEKAIDAIDAIRSNVNVVIDKAIVNSFLSRFEGYTEAQIAAVEKLADMNIKRLVDNGVIVPYVTFEESISIATDFALYVCKEKAKPYKEEEKYTESIKLLYSEEFTKQLSELYAEEREGKHFLNVVDLVKVGINFDLVPNNFVVWHYATSARNILTYFSEFNKEYNYICCIKKEEPKE